MKHLILLISLITLLDSCGSKSIPDGYWIDYDKTHLFHFDASGDIVFIDKYNTVITKDKFEIKVIEPEFISLSGKNGVEGFVKATKADFLLGIWYGTLKNKPNNLRFKYSSADNKWSMYEDYLGDEMQVDFSLYDNDIITVESEKFEFKFSKDKDSLLLYNDMLSIQLIRGYLPQNEDDYTTSGDYTFMDAKKINALSHSSTKWKEIRDVDFFALNSENHIRYKNQLFKGPLSDTKATSVQVSPISEYQKFAVVNAGDGGFFLCDLDRMASFKVDIYSPSNWLSWSPNLDFVIFHHYYEADGTLYSYNLRTHELTELFFGSEYNDIEQLVFDLVNLKWDSHIEFEIPATINCNPYNSETDCDGLGHAQVLMSKIYYYNVHSHKIMESKDQ